MKYYFIRFFAVIILLAFYSCEKESEPIDFRIKYYGEFHFQTIKEFWLMSQPTIYDTFYYDGVIREFHIDDSEDDMYPANDDLDENPNEKITIQFLKNRKITSILEESGNLVQKHTTHYWHKGGFVDTDSIVFAILDLGGLGAGYNYYITGMRLD